MSVASRSSKVSKNNCAKRPFRSVNLSNSVVRPSVRPVRDFRDFYEEDMEVLQRQMPRVYFQKKCPRFFSKLKKTPHVWRLPPDYGLRRDPILDLFWTPFLAKKWKKYKKVTFVFQAGNDRFWWTVTLRATCPAGCYLVYYLNFNLRTIFSNRGNTFLSVPQVTHCDSSGWYVMLSNWFVENTL